MTEIAHRDEAPVEAHPAVLLLEEAAAALRICPDTLRRAAARGEVRGVLRLGRCLRFVGSELLGCAPKISLATTCTVVELAAALRVHPDTIRAAVAAGQLDGVHRVGTALRFDAVRVVQSLACQALESRIGEAK